MRRKQIAVFTAASIGLVVYVLLAGFGWAILASPGPSGYHILKTIHLSGTEGWDYLNATAIDAAKGTVAGTVQLDGQPEFVVADGKGSVFITLPTKTRLSRSMQRR